MVPPHLTGAETKSMSNENLIAEINEELRSDRVRKFWKTFGPWVIGLMVAIVLVVAGKEGYETWSNINSAQSSDQFYAALDLADGTDYAAAQKALDDLAAKGFAGYPRLARFREAALLAQQGKVQEAVAAYDALATGESNKSLRELALAMAGMLLVDTGDVAQVSQRVEGLLSPDSAMRNVAHEALGLVNYKAGKLDEAQKQFEAAAADPLSSQEFQGRLQVYLAQLISEGATSPSAAAPADSATPAADSTAPADSTTPSTTDAAPATTQPAAN